MILDYACQVYLPLRVCDLDNKKAPLAEGFSVSLSFFGGGSKHSLGYTLRV